MPYDVSVLIPAFEADDFIRHAVASVRKETKARVEIVLCSDDGKNYVDLVKRQGLDTADLVACSTGGRGTGTANARNAAARHTSGEYIACVDADDEFPEHRIALLLEAAAKGGAATGPTFEISKAGELLRTAQPADGKRHLDLADITDIRMPYSPLFHKSLLGDGWPSVHYAEDMIYNVMLHHRARQFAFVPQAGYNYFRRPGSLSEGRGTFANALRGYADILKLMDRCELPEATRNKVRDVISEDIAMVEHAKAHSKGGEENWKDAYAAWQAIKKEVRSAPGSGG